MVESHALIELTEVRKRYEGPSGAPAEEVLRGVDLRVDRGEALAIVGPSGSGKSTLLNIIGALDSPTGGRVMLDGRDLATLGEKALAELRNREIGFIFQLHHLLGACTVLENVLVPTLVTDRRARADADRRARRLLERVGLSDRLSHRPAELSGGERQRVAAVRALINRPKLLLADEPTGSLDRAASENLTALLAELNAEEGVTLVVVTHSLELADRLGEVRHLTGGRLSDGDARP